MFIAVINTSETHKTTKDSKCRTAKNLDPESRGTFLKSINILSHITLFSLMISLNYLGKKCLPYMVAMVVAAAF